MPAGLLTWRIVKIPLGCCSALGLARGAHQAMRRRVPVLGVRPSSSRTMWRIASSSRNSESMVSMSRMRGAWMRGGLLALHLNF